MVLSSGLVSLNIHDSLTFEGTEICLHPDLFSINTNCSNNINNSSSNNSISNSLINNNNNNNNNATIITTTTINNSNIITDSDNNIINHSSSSVNSVVGVTNHQQSHQNTGSGPSIAPSRSPPRLSTTSTTVSSVPGKKGHAGNNLNNINSNINNSTNGANGANGSKSFLQVGDMIEIRVWDPITRSTGSSTGLTSSPTINAMSSIVRRRAAPYIPPPIVAGPKSHHASNAQITSTVQSLSSTLVAPTGNFNNSINTINSINTSRAGNTVKALAVFGDSDVGSVAQLSAPSTTAPLHLINSSSSQIYFQESTDGIMRSNDGADSTNKLINSRLTSTNAVIAKAPMAPTSDSFNSNTETTTNQLIKSSSLSSPKILSKKSLDDSSTDYDPIVATKPDNTTSITTSNNPAVLPPGQSFLPPVFPKGRINHSEGQASGSGNRLLSSKRPNTVQRRSASTSGVIPLSGPHTNQENNSSANKTNSLTIPGTAPITTVSKNTRHYRDLSDMTVETISGSSITSEFPFQTTTTTTMPGPPLATGPVPLETVTPNVIDLPIHRNLTTVVPVSSDESTLLGNGPSAAETNDEDDDGWSHLMQTHTLRLSFVMLVGDKTLTSLKGSARTQVSILRQVADLYRLSSYDMLTINKVEKCEETSVLSAVSADFVLVTIKDQFISRGDMHYFQSSLIGTWLYEGQRLYESNRGIQAIARAIRHGDRLARSGIVTDKTTVTFRSRSARIMWLVQMSAEMWDYASPYERGKNEGLCEIYFDKWISFVHELFLQWKDLEATHSLTVVFFSRTYRYDKGPGLSSSARSRTKIDSKYDHHGRSYDDQYRLVIENMTGPDWESVVQTLKKAFVSYPHEVGWNLATGEASRHPSNACQGNVLEAINVTLNQLQYHYFDRDLHRSGNSIVLISAGNGVFEVDQGLAGITYQRMMDNGIGSDMLSLSLPALHIAPFFLYNNMPQGTTSEDFDSHEQYYEVPHWMHLSFVCYESDKTVFGRPVDQSLKVHSTPQSESIPALDIRANGFLVPTTLPFQGHALQKFVTDSFPSSFSVRGNDLASPVVEKSTKASRERQLIAGRDFRDILEACRPRNAKIMPTPLRAALEFYDDSTYEANICNLSKDDTRDSVHIAKEYGAMDLDEMNKQVKPLAYGISTQRREPNKSASGLPYLGERHENTFSFNQLKPASLFNSSTAMSQISVGVLGTSYDRPYLASLVSSGTSDVQLQRPVLLNYSFIDSMDSDSETPLSTTNSSDDEGDDGNRIGACTTLEDRYRQMFLTHDTLHAQSSIQTGVERLLNPSLTRMESAISNDRTTTSTRFTAISRVQNAQVISSGGLDAALQQHRMNSSSNGVLTDIPKPMTTSLMMRGMGRNGNASMFRPIPDSSSRGMSPLLLPPTVMAVESADILPDGRLRPDKRIVNPQDFSVRVSSDSGSRKLHDNLGLLSGSLVTDSRPEGRNRPVDSRSFSLSPPTDRNKVPGSFSRTGGEIPLSRMTDRRNRSKYSKRALNPFRQQDEEEVLAMKTHNRRRWSHVFPLGETEFKRHAGPNWRSLSAPAILPISIDYFPTQEEIDKNFTFSIYNVTLSEFERRNFSSTEDLLTEMVRQRITQDFQLVSEDNVNASNYRPESLRHSLSVANRTLSIADSGGGVVRHFLSMGHRLHVLTYDPASDVVEVTRYNAINAQQKSALNTFEYQYYTYCRETQRYNKVIQTFEKYADQYNWNKFDRIMCGDDDRELREGMRFRRLMFGIIPDKFEDRPGEQEYVAKFHRLVEYLNKLRDKDESQSPLNIKFVTKFDKPIEQDKGRTDSIPGIAHNSMQRFYIQLRKGTKDTMEWIEVVVDATFNTSWSFRIILNWLVASSGKVDAQVQLLQRRCTQYGLNLIPFPQVSVSRNIYLNPFKAPAIFCVRCKNKSAALDSALSKIDFLHDGVFYTDVNAILECNDLNAAYLAPTIGAACRQFVHRSGTLFVRIFTDRNGFSVLVVLGNYRYLLSCNKDDNFLVNSYRRAFLHLQQCIDSLDSDLK